MYVFNERLKLLRKLSNLTQQELAGKINSSPYTIQSYELLTRKPTYETLCALADYFDVSIDYLVGRTDNPEVNK